MPVPRFHWTLVGIAALAMSALSPSRSLAQTDVIRGRVTTIEGLPLPGVRVNATSIPGNVTRTARTDNRGSFQIVFPGGTGDYMMGYALIGYVYRQFQIKRIADEDVLIANSTLSVVQLDTIAVVAPVQQRVGRNSPTPDVSGTERQVAANNLPPEQQGDIAAMAASLPGVLLVPGLDGGADGFSVLGLGADQNSVTLNGMQFGANGLPRDAGISSSLTTSPYDPSRGGFSGGNFNIRSSAGSNFRNVGMSAVFNAPQLQWTDRAARALGTEFTNVSLGGVASGPIVLNKAFYNVSYQLGRNSRDNQTLLGTSALGLQTAGVATDSVERFLGILQGTGIPGVGGPFRPQRVSDNGSVFGSVDLSPPSSTSGQSFNLTFNGNWAKQHPVSGGATQLASASGERTNWGGGLQARHNSYVKLILSETQAGFNVSRDHGDPYLDLPSGRVRVTSVFADGASGVQNLTFGGNQGLSSSSRSANSTFMNTLSWFDDANKHRVKFTTELQYSDNRQDPSSNLLGTFNFNSLEDLELGRPASFSRTLRTRERTTAHATGSVALGDSYRRTQDLQIQYGGRLDAIRYIRTPQYNPIVESTFGRRNDRVPTPVTFSPRVGFSWTLGESNEIAAFTGAFRGPRAVLRGGLGIFSNGAGGGQIGSAIDNTGLPSGFQQIFCVGPAAPIPDWTVYAADLASVPENCADGTAGTVFANAAPNVTLFASNFRPQRTVRSNLSWNGSILDARFSANVEGTYSLNLNQQRSVDLNFDGVTRFTLADDSRPVFVDTASIVAATGSIASRDARVTQAFARVTEMRSDLQSRTAQLSLRINPITRGPSTFGWSAAYTFSHIREQVSGFNSTSSNPLLVEWARSGQGPHQISYTLRYLFFRAIQVNWNGSFRSGAAYTPMVAGDINGDGYSNDRAFIHSAATGDSAVTAGMSQLLQATSGNARACLLRQMGRIASRNSCRGPWTSNASLNVTLDRAKFRMPHRASISFSLSNPLGAADLLLNGSGHLRGWGQNAVPDQSLLYVRGFDAQAQRYRYEVNQRFGATRPQFLTLRSPVTLTTSMRVDLGPMRERQNLQQSIGSGRTRQGSRMPESALRSMGVNSVPNPMTSILRQQDSLRLTSVQADSIAVLNRRFTYRSDSLWAPVTRYLAGLPAQFDEGEAYDRYMRARRTQIDMLMEMAPHIRGLLTPAQRRKLPASVINVLDPRYLVSIRNGTSTYVGSAGSGGPSGFFFFEGGATPVFRGP
jgi:hypothetical protein